MYVVIVKIVEERELKVREESSKRQSDVDHQR